jgi:outer membrane protein insertion porin family
MVLESGGWFKQKILKKEPSGFTQELLEQDLNRVTRLYQKSGYLDASAIVETKLRRNNRMDISVNIDPGPPIKISTVKYELESNEELKESLPRRNYRSIQFGSQANPNIIFRDEIIYSDQLHIAGEFNSAGYPYARVSYDLKVDTIDDKAALTWKIQKGISARFGPTSIIGNERISDKLIYKQLRYDENDTWSGKSIEDTQDQIYSLGVFRIVSFKAQISDTLKEKIPLTIQVEEAPRWTTRFGAGYGREDGIRAFGEFQYLGFLTQTSRLNLYAKHSGLEPYHFYLRFSQPAFLIPVNTFSIYPYLKSANEPAYQLHKFGINLSMLQNFSNVLNTSFGIEIEDVSIDSAGNDSFRNEGEDIEYYRKSSILLGGIFNNAEPFLDPVQGYVISFSLKSNGNFLFTDVPFNRILGEYKSYHGLGTRVILAVKIKAGVIFQREDELEIPVDERFFAGGSYSVRGWKRSELGPKDEQGIPIGGNSLLEGSIEFRIQTLKSTILALFCDAGNVWSKSYSFHPGDLHYAAGFGVRIKTPIGPAGLDFARPIFESGSWQFHLNIGHSF